MNDSELSLLRESERRFRELLTNINLIAIMLDRVGRITFCNPYLLRLAGFGEEEVIGANWFDIFIPEENRSALLDLFAQGIANSSFPAHYENEIITRTGLRRSIFWDNTVIRDADGVIIGCASVGRDVTEQLRLEERVRQTQKMESLGRLAGGIAHDFNNLLMVILGYSNRLLSRPESEGGFTHELQQIAAAAERAASLTRQLLTFSRHATGLVTVMCLDEAVAGIEPMLKRLIEENIEVSLSLNAKTGSIRADLNQIEQVIVNLALNARDAMPEGGKLFIGTSIIAVDNEFASATLSLEQGEYVSLAVSDTGTGMTPEVQSRLFEPFFTTKEVGKGTGLGLSTVYGIVGQAGGVIRVHSTPGLGTSFRVFFPAVKAQPLPEDHPAVASDLRGEGTILLAEDEDGVRNYVSQALQEHGYSVLAAGGGHEAMELANRHPEPIHLLLTDMVLPGMNGMELIRLFRAIRPEAPVLRMSGYPECVGAEIDGSIAYLQKPFSARALLERVGMILDKGRHAPVTNA